MITMYSIHTSPKHQYKLHNSQILARNMRAIYPEIPRTPETVETINPEPSTWENISMRRREMVRADAKLRRSNVYVGGAGGRPALLPGLAGPCPWCPRYFSP